MKHLTLLLAFFALTMPVFADQQTFTGTTDKDGNLTQQGNVPLGKVTVLKVSCTDSFASAVAVLDGSKVFESAITANTWYSVNATAKKNISVTLLGGPANKSVTVTVEYKLSIWGTAEPSRTVETDKIKTDADGACSSSDNVGSGTITLKSFSFSHAFSKVTIVCDGTQAFGAAVNAGQKYPLNNVKAKKNITVKCTGGPANTEVSVTVEYTYSPFAFTVQQDRATSTDEVDTDETGSFASNDSISAGSVRVQSFSTSHNFGNVTIKMDGNEVFNGEVVAGQSYSLNNSKARNSIVVNGTNGPVSTKVAITTNYTYSPFGMIAQPEGRPTETDKVHTDSEGAFSSNDAISAGSVTLKSFVVSYNFANVTIVMDGNTVFNGAVNAGQTYTLSNPKARRSIVVNGNGGPADTDVDVTVTYSYSPFAMSRPVLLGTSQERASSTDSFRTDANGGFESHDTNSAGTITLISFSMNQSFGNVTITADGVQVFNGAVTAGQTYSLNNAKARRNIDVIGTSGPADTDTTCTTNYSYSPF